MDHFLLIVIFFIFFILTNAQTGRIYHSYIHIYSSIYITESDTSVTNTSWFWPLLGICLALILSIPSALIIVIFIYYNKHKSNNDSDESSTRSNSSISERQDRNPRHVPGCPSPPPSYTNTTYDQPANVFMIPSPPPPYEPDINENLPTTNDVPPPPPTELDVSAATLTSPSIQTFQA
jgi:hypothetical protein